MVLKSSEQTCVTITYHDICHMGGYPAISNLGERAADLEIQYHSICQEKITQDVLEVQSNIRERKKK